MEYNEEESKRLAKEIRAQLRACWLNAAMGLPRVEGGFYVEGYMVVLGGIVMEHGWIEHPDKGIIDPTAALFQKPDDEVVLYFPALRWSSEEFMQALQDNEKELPLMWQYGWGGMDSPEVRAANQRAWEATGIPLDQLEKLQLMIGESL